MTHKRIPNPLRLFAHFQPSLFDQQHPEELMIASISPAAVPALRIAGAVFLILHFLIAGYLFSHRRRLFDRDPEVRDDFEAVRHLRVEVILIPWVFIGAVLLVTWLGLWTK